MKPTKFVLFNDAHLSYDNPVARLDDCRETGYRKMEFVLDWAQKNNAVILHAGDLCHKPRSWHLLSDLQNVFMSDDPFYTIYGQHDTVMYNEQTRHATIVGALIGAGFIKLLNTNPIQIDRYNVHNCVDKYNIYGCSYGQEIPQPQTHDNILVIHAPITDKAQWQGQDYLDALTFLKNYKEFNIIICGDIHQKFCIEYQGRYIVNAGPMIRREASIYNFSHHPGFWVWDFIKETMSWQEISHLPAKQVLTRDHIDYKDEAENILTEFISAIKNKDVNDNISFIDNLWAFVKENQINEDIIYQIALVIGEEKFYGKRK